MPSPQAQLLPLLPPSRVPLSRLCSRAPRRCRFPSPVVFNAADPAHAAFIQAAAILKAQVCVWW